MVGLGFYCSSLGGGRHADACLSLHRQRSLRRHLSAVCTVSMMGIRMLVFGPRPSVIHRRLT